MINGICIMIVFLTHFSGYIEPGSGDMIYIRFGSMSGQFPVVPFLFYSGYGMMYSIMKKGQQYVRGIPFKRFFKVWYHFAVAIILYIVVNLITGTHHGVLRIFTAFIAWKSIGNSSWYIFATLSLYVFVFISFSIIKNNYKLSILLVVLMCFGYIAVEIFAKKNPICYNTILVYPVGMLFAVYKDKAEKIIQKNIFTYLGILAGLLLTFIVLYRFKGYFVCHELCAIVLALMITVITMKVKIGNPILGFLGGYVFEIYILHRIPMILLHNMGINNNVYIAVCAAATLVLSLGFKLLTNKTDRLIYNRKKD